MVLQVKWWMLSHNVMDVMFLVLGVEMFFCMGGSERDIRDMFGGDAGVRHMCIYWDNGRPKLCTKPMCFPNSFYLSCHPKHLYLSHSDQLCLSLSHYHLI